MVRKTKATPNAAKMYRHFAAVTVVITIAVALMADSDSRREVVAAVEEHQSGAELQQQSDAIVASGSLIDNSHSGDIVGVFGDDSWVGHSGGRNSSIINPGSQAEKDMPWVRLGMSQSDFEMLPPEQRKRLLARLQSSQPDQATIAHISEQSLRRSGRTAPSSDAPGSSRP